MKKNFVLYAIFLLIGSGCAEKRQNPYNNQNDSLCLTKKDVVESADDSETNDNNEKEKDMIDISDLFSSEELEKIRYNYISQLRFEFKSFSIGYELAPLSEAKYKDFINH